MNLFTYEKGYCFVYYLSQLCGDPRHFDSFLRVSVNKHVFLLRSRAGFFQVLSLWLIDRGKVEYKWSWDGRMMWACLSSQMFLSMCDRFFFRFLLSECACAVFSSQTLRYQIQRSNMFLLPLVLCSKQLESCCSIDYLWLECCDFIHY